jgi:mono/diheme cytochrome c family protein
MAPSLRRPLLACGLAAAALAVGACGEHGIQLAKSNPDYEGAVIFSENCAACHTLDAAGSEGSATKIHSRERKDGPNFNQRKEDKEDVLYAIRNGGFSSSPMPQNLVTGDAADKVAAFVAKYSGSQAASAAGTSPGSR